MKKRELVLSSKITIMAFFLLLIFTSMARSGNLEWMANDYPIFDHDDTLLEGDMLHPGPLVQLIWAPDGVIDPPLPDGSPGGDDQLVHDASSDPGRDSGENPIYIGYGTGPLPLGKFYVSDITYTLSPGEMVYTRIFNAASPDLATHYGDSDLYALTGDVGESWDCTESAPIVTNIFLCNMYYRDMDGDGYGISEDSQCLNAPDIENNYTATLAGDCTDTDPNIHPDATEICDSNDNDCDGHTDEENARGCTTYYKDADGDGYGVDEDSRCLCTPEGIYTTIYGGDPDDTNPDVIPEVKLVEMNLAAGWSMISLPVSPQSTVASELFPGARVMYGYRKGLGYVLIKAQDELAVGQGYWIKLDEDRNYPITGMPIQAYNIPVDGPGWNMIGGCTYPARASISNGKILVIYRYEQGTGYKRLVGDDKLEPGQSYWIQFSDFTGQAELRVEVER